MRERWMDGDGESNLRLNQLNHLIDLNLMLKRERERGPERELDSIHSNGSVVLMLD